MVKKHRRPRGLGKPERPAGWSSADSRRRTVDYGEADTPWSLERITGVVLDDARRQTGNRGNRRGSGRSDGRGVLNHGQRRLGRRNDHAGFLGRRGGLARHFLGLLLDWLSARGGGAAAAAAAATVAATGVAAGIAMEQAADPIQNLAVAEAAATRIAAVVRAMSEIERGPGMPAPTVTTVALEQARKAVSQPMPDAFVTAITTTGAAGRRGRMAVAHRNDHFRRLPDHPSR